MGLKSSKPKLSKEDLEFLKKNTNFTEDQIKEWYKGFVVSLIFKFYRILNFFLFFFCPRSFLPEDVFPAAFLFRKKQENLPIQSFAGGSSSGFREATDSS